MGKFLSSLEAEQIQDDDSTDEGRGTWRLLAPLIYLADSGVTYSAPAGFVTDFASIPRIPIVFDIFGDRANLAASLHDWLYTADPITKLHPCPDRLTADQLLREACLAQGVGKFIAYVLYLGVRLGGASHWA